MPASTLSYVLVTPARNEEAFIELTIKSVIAQTVLPRKWVIVSDGSTDRTDEIVSRYLVQHPWIELVRMPESRDRHFAAKVACINAGCERLQGLEYDIFGSLDADISFAPDYFAFLLEKFAANPKLGVAGTPFVEGDDERYDYRFASLEHVSGACQLFRRQCWEGIGGYVPVKGGGIDCIAVMTARMKGWQTRTFTERVCRHHRLMGTAAQSKLRACFKLGREDYYLGGHPLWQFFRGCYQMSRHPYVAGGLLILAGYAWASLTRVHRPVSQELIRFHRSEQMRRLRHLPFHAVRRRPSESIATRELGGM